jgi:hypothetical protein
MRMMRSTEPATGEFGREYSLKNIVIPAKAGSQMFANEKPHRWSAQAFGTDGDDIDSVFHALRIWVPAFARMTTLFSVWRAR